MRISTSGGGKTVKTDPNQMNLVDILSDDSQEAKASSPFVDRLYKRAGELGISIGDLETKNGVSKGYLSRLKKSENPEGAISAKVLSNMADMLKEPIEYFLQDDYAELTPKEQTVIDFLDKLRKETINMKIEWERDDISWLDALQGASPAECDMDEIDDHPLFIYIDAHDVMAYNSTFYKAPGIRPNGSFFHTWLPAQNTNVYITNLREFNASDQDKPIYEIYLVPKSTEENRWATPQGVCNTNLSREIFYNMVERLYFAAEEASTHIKLDEGVEGILNSFISDTSESN